MSESHDPFLRKNPCRPRASRNPPDARRCSFPAPSHEEIARLAYAYWEARGRQHGSHRGRLVPRRTRTASPPALLPNFNAWCKLVYSSSAPRGPESGDSPNLLRHLRTIFLLSAAAGMGHAQTVTFNEHIAPIIYGNCTKCHHPGEVAPFSLLSLRRRAHARADHHHGDPIALHAALEARARMDRLPR